MGLSAGNGRLQCLRNSLLAVIMPTGTYALFYIYIYAFYIYIYIKRYTYIYISISDSLSLSFLYIYTHDVVIHDIYSASVM